MRTHLLLCGLAALAACASAPRAPGEALDPRTRAALASEMAASLGADLAAWYPRAVDPQQGGFLSRFDYRWQPAGTQEKMIVTQARHVWTTSRAALFLGDRRFLAPAAHGYAFLRDRMWDAGDGGFFWLVTRGGMPVPESDGRVIKQAYGQAYGIYALAAYYDATRDTAALRLAADAFHWLDDHAHDPVHGGYFNYLDRDGTALRAGYADTPPKDQNSSIHLLEAFTELYRVWPDSLVALRLREMLLLVRDTIRVDPGYLTLFSTADWQPVSYRDSSEAVREARFYFDHVSFGHDVETAYLLLDAAEALDGRADTTTLRVAKQMADHALRTGWDRSTGGFYEAGYYFRDRPGLTVVRDTKNWWAQAEGLNTLLLLADLYPDDPLRYGEKFLVQWAYVKRYLIDDEHGGWYEGGLDREPERRVGDKAHVWKAAYHDSRALMNVVRRLRAPAARAGGPLFH